MVDAAWILQFDGFHCRHPFLCKENRLSDGGFQIHNSQNDYVFETWWMRMLEELRTLVLFAEEGSIQKVARRLPLTQPAVTRQIQRLEDMLATTLLDRRQKPPRLTQAGLDVLARGRDILASVEALKSFVGSAEPEGVLRLGLAHGLSDKDVAGGHCQCRRFVSQRVAAPQDRLERRARRPV
ncbi:LysR family transcriptional regulator [Mesorhizobium calcicola]|uniref:LysR family transcriptional regulator n=1 Tax=Mesorhizobium calcicola TaxID=1300310 RepID=A0ABW4WIW5_9HYPH